jgi:hypothetical protein
MIKDTLVNAVYEGTGVQAEILLYMNDHSFVGDTSLEPRIPQRFGRAALLSMSTEKCPVLLVYTEGSYKVNAQWPTGPVHLTLPAPTVKDELETARQALDSKISRLEAFVMRKMKENRILGIRDLEDQAHDELSNIFHISTDDFRHVIESLIRRGFIEHTTKNRLIYMS